VSRPPNRIEYRYPVPPVRVRLLARPNRFLVRVVPWAGGRPFSAHLPNPGRMEELLVPGMTEGWAVAAGGPHRRTRFDLVVVRHAGELVSVDPRASNRLVGEALRRGLLPGVPTRGFLPEFPWKGRRLDFGHDEDGKPFAYSVTLFLAQDRLYLVETGGAKSNYDLARPSLEWMAKSVRVRFTRWLPFLTSRTCNRW